MSIRSLASPVLGLALLFATAPASGVSLTLANESDTADRYAVVLFIDSDSGGDATFSACGSGVCSSGWEMSVTVSEQANTGDSPFVYSGTLTHDDGDTSAFSGLYRIADGNGGTGASTPHGTETDFYGHGLGLAGGRFFFALTASHVVPEPAAALLVGSALIGVLRRASRLRAR